MENQGLSGGAKAGYFALGFFLALIGVLISWLMNKDKAPEVKNGAIKFSVIGFVVVFVLYILSAIFLMPMYLSTMGVLY